MNMEQLLLAGSGEGGWGGGVGLKETERAGSLEGEGWEGGDSSALSLKQPTTQIHVHTHSTLTNIDTKNASP